MKTAESKLRLDLFDRRFHVYSAARKLIGLAVIVPVLKDEEVFDFLINTREALWLFNADIARYLDADVKNHANALHALQATFNADAASETCEGNLDRQARIKEWFKQQYDVLDRLFAPYLQLTH